MEESDFTGLFLQEVNSKRDELINYFKVTSSDPSTVPVTEYIQRKLIEVWKSLSSDYIEKLRDEKDKLRIIAVDSSLYGRFYAQGKALYIIRSVAVSRQKSLRHLIIEYDTSTHSRNVSRTMKLLAESSEYLVALKALSQIPKEDPTVIVLDGSLYTRLIHTPMEFNVDRNRDAYIKALSSFLLLYAEASSREVPIIGIAKDSLSEHLRIVLIKEAISDILEVLVDKGIKVPNNTIRETSSIVEFFNYCERLVRKLENRYKKLEEIALLRKFIDELKHRHSDYNLLMSFNLPPGFSLPLLVGCMRGKCYRRIKKLKEYGILKFVTKIWKNTLKELDDFHAREFIAEASKLLLNLIKLPPLYVLYILPEQRALPLRIELLLPNTINDISFFSFRNVRFTSLPSQVLDMVLNVVLNNYADMSVYNTWLFAAHRIAKISLKEFQAYEAYLRNLGLDLIPRRRIWLG